MDGVYCPIFSNISSGTAWPLQGMILTHRGIGLWSVGFSSKIRLQRSPNFEHRCRHFEQYSAVRPRFRDVIPSESGPSNAIGSLRAGSLVWVGYRGQRSWREECVRRFAVLYRLWPWYPTQTSAPARRLCHWVPGEFENGSLRDEFLQDSGHFKGWNFAEWKSFIFTWYRRRH